MPAPPQLTRRSKGCHALRVPPPRPRLMDPLARGSRAAPAPLLVHRRRDPFGPTVLAHWSAACRLSAPLGLSTLPGRARQRCWPLGHPRCVLPFPLSWYGPSPLAPPLRRGATCTWRTGAAPPRTTPVPWAAPVPTVANTHLQFVNATAVLASRLPVRCRTQGSAHPTAPLAGASIRSVTSAGMCPGAHPPAGPGSVLSPPTWRRRNVPWGFDRPTGQGPKQPRPYQGKTAWKSGSQCPFARTPFTVTFAAFT